MQVPAHLCLQEESWTMKTCKLLDACVRETKAGKLGGGASDAIARDIAAIAIESMPDDIGLVDKRELRMAVAERYMAEHKPGFLFSMIVLPVMISLISHWLVQWFKNRPSQLKELKAAASGGCACRLRTGATPTCTSTEKEKNSTSSTSSPDTWPKEG